MVKHMDDQEIIRRLFERDETALEAIERQYGRFCLASALPIVCDEETAKECVNDTLLAVWNGIPPYRPRFFKTYLARIVKQIAIDRLRKETAAKRGGAEGILSFEEIGEEIRAKDTIWETLEQQELNRALAAFVESLSARDRTIFLLRYWQMERQEAIAQKTGLSAGAVNVRLHRIRRKLRAFLKEGGWME